MRRAYIIATACTAFGKRPNDTFQDLTREVYESVLRDARLGCGDRIENAWFSNCGMGTFGQRNIRGQVCFTPLVKEGRFPERIPMINVEGGCASGSMALHGAWKDILSGTADLSLAIGVEKTFFPGDAEKTREIFEGGIDQLAPGQWQDYYSKAGDEAGKPFEPNGGGGTVFMNTYAMQAAYHMKQYGTSDRDIAYAASKNHYYGSLNRLAQYRFEISPEAVLADRPVSFPLTRAMCAPVGDGAAAALVCSDRFLRSMPKEVQERAIAICASVLTGGKYRALSENGLSHEAARRAYRMADLTPDAIDVVELHDATSFSDIYQSEMLGFCEKGAGGEFVSSGATRLEGKKPTNLSGGLVSKGHPVGATGLSMIYELGLQLRGEAGARQARKAQYALAENGGGSLGFDEAACSVTILQRPWA